ncbi:MAG: hypothetical protein WCC17_14895 [Candidatus Nitrosopolaris sp.]
MILPTTGKELFLILFILTDCLAAFVQDNKGSAVNGICHHVGQKENQTGIHYIWDKLKQGTSIRSLITTDGKIDTVYA